VAWGGGGGLGAKKRLQQYSQVMLRRCEKLKLKFIISSAFALTDEIALIFLSEGLFNSLMLGIY